MAKQYANIYGYGQLFAASGLDLGTDWNNDFVGVTMHDEVSLRFETPIRFTLKVGKPVSGKYKAVLSDIIESESGDILLAMFSRNSLIGTASVMPIVDAPEYTCEKTGDVAVYISDSGAIALKTFVKNGKTNFALAYDADRAACIEEVERASASDFDAVKRERYAYYDGICLPQYDKKYERLVSKLLSVGKVNVYSPSGDIESLWTTPDRVPHKNMWLWDSVFHAIGYSCYNVELAKSAVEAVLRKQRADGLIPHMMTPVGESAIAQPPVLSFGVLYVFEKSGDKDFVARNVSRLEKYIAWDLENRDENGNLLSEWFIEEKAHCRSGESGMDNSPRFDGAEPLDSVDFSSFLSFDCKCLGKLFEILGDGEKSRKYFNLGERIKNAVNENLWDEKNGLYGDKRFDGTFTGIFSVASFIPLFTEVATEHTAAKLAEHLDDAKSFGGAFPVPSMPKNSPLYKKDMWRGAVWINYNYMIAVGLEKYGFFEKAQNLREKTLATVKRWYELEGTVYEFYDSDDEIAPYSMERKGVCPSPPDFRKKMHSICDYNWTAQLTLAMIMDDGQRRVK